MSILMKLAVYALRLRPKPLATEAKTIVNAAKPHQSAPVPASLQRTHDTEEGNVAGVPLLTLHPRNIEAVGQLLYIHGGAYIHDMISPHWDIIQQLVRDLPLTVHVPMYGLAPKHTAAEALPALERLHQRLSEQPTPFFIAGDSAGATISLATVLQGRDYGWRAPAAVLLFAPWVDATLSNPAIAAIEPYDPMLGAEGLRWTAQQWAGTDSDVKDRRFSPINDHLRNLPTTRIYQGGRDIFLPDAEAFAAKAQAAGSDCTIRVFPDAFHVFVGLPFLPESREALDDARKTMATLTAR